MADCRKTRSLTGASFRAAPVPDREIRCYQKNRLLMRAAPISRDREGVIPRSRGNGVMAQKCLHPANQLSMCTPFSWQCVNVQAAGHAGADIVDASAGHDSDVLLAVLPCESNRRRLGVGDELRDPKLFARAG